jgi:uncharacterized protein YwgA
MHTRQEICMSTIGPRELLLLLIGLDDIAAPEGLGGITRIQKLLYILQTEEHIRPAGDGFKFEPYKAGPYSPRIYDELQLLENLNYIRRASSGEHDSDDITTERISAEASDPEKAEVDLTFEELMGPEDVMTARSDEIAPTADSYEEARFFLTDTGKNKIEKLLENPDYKPFVDGIRRVKSRFSKYSLNDLLYYVYTRHPTMTTESEIKEKVLRRRPS